MNRLRIGRAVALAALFASAPALADRPFILPSSTLLSGDGAAVTFDAAGSDHVFFFDHRPLAMETIRVIRPDGTIAAPTNPTRLRLRSVFDLRLDQQGTWTIASEQAIVTGSFLLDGEERRVGGRPPGQNAPPSPAGGEARGAGERGGPSGDAPRRKPPVPVADIPAGATEVHLAETIARTATFVTAGAPTPVARPTGRGLEFDPVTHPNAIAAGETAHFRFLIDGKPAAGIKVTVVQGGERYRDAVGSINLTTASDGSVAIRWPSAGMYWLGAEAEDAHPVEPRAERRRMSYAATLEVMTP